MEYPSCIGKRCTVLPLASQTKVKTWRGEIHTLNQRLRDDLLMHDDTKASLKKQIAEKQKLVNKEFWVHVNGCMDDVDDNLAGVDNLVASAQGDLISAANKMEMARNQAASARNLAEEAIQHKK